MLWRYLLLKYLVEEFTSSTKFCHDVKVTSILIELINLDDVGMILKIYPFLFTRVLRMLTSSFNFSWSSKEVAVLDIIFTARVYWVILWTAFLTSPKAPRMDRSINLFQVQGSKGCNRYWSYPVFPRPFLNGSPWDPQSFPLFINMHSNLSSEVFEHLMMQRTHNPFNK